MTVIQPIAGVSSSSPGADNGLRKDGPTTQHFAMLAHDIRGALAGVIGGVSAIEEAAVPQEIADQIARIATASRSLDSLIGLLIGDVEESDSGESNNDVDLAEFAAYLRRRWAGEAVQAGGKLVVDIADDLVGQLSMERMALARLVGNLIRNAILHGAGADIQVTFRKGQSGGCVLTVADNGPGLPAGIVTASPSSTLGSVSSGRGLGLEIVRTLSKEIGAEFEIHNRVEGGAEANVAFPEACLSVASHGPDKNTHFSKDSETSLSGVRVLLAEDNPTNQMVANQMLRALEAEVTISSDGVEALEAFEKDAYDLVVVDIEMPRMSGLDVIRAIRSRKDERAVVPIVALTAYALREHRDRIAEAGANGLISKPITSIESLGVALSEYISASRELETSQPADSDSLVATDQTDPVVDMAVYQALCDAIGDDMMAELLDKVIGDLEEARSELHAAISPLNLTPVRSVSHILISVAGAIGANRLQHGARDLNKAAHSEDSDVQSRSTALLDDIDAAIEFARVRDRVAEGTGMSERLLLVEDTSSLSMVYHGVLTRAGHAVACVYTLAEARAHLEQESPRLVLLDLQLPDGDGLELLRELRLESPEAKVIVITANGSINRAVEAMRAGAFDFLVKPFDEGRLINAVHNALGSAPNPSPAAATTEPVDSALLHGFIGASPKMKHIYGMIDSIGRSTATVFITGESGTGKEVCARAIHEVSTRAKKPFVPLNCAAIPRDLLESEVFGHLKGAFTGALSDKPGAAAVANGGTLFLDEICEMDLSLQTKLLRFLQTSMIQPVGAARAQSVDVRIVCATNRDPMEEVRAGRFREDLYYRLHVVPIHMPPLRERREDIMTIAQAYLEEFAAEEGKSLAAFHPEVARTFLGRPWPGNVRQLINVVRNIVVLHDGAVVLPEMLPHEIVLDSDVGAIPVAPVQPVDAIAFSNPVPSTVTAGRLDGLIGMSLAEIERAFIEATIEHCGGSVPRAAKVLEVSPSTIYRKLENWASEQRQAGA